MKKISASAALHALVTTVLVFLLPSLPEAVLSKTLIVREST